MNYSLGSWLLKLANKFLEKYANDVVPKRSLIEVFFHPKRGRERKREGRKEEKGEREREERRKGVSVILQREECACKVEEG